MNVQKIAAKDAARWAYAEMFFGQGAGTRRKLLSNEIASKVERVSGYHEAFQKAYAKQDMAKHAIAAAKERKRLDRSNVVGRNVRALARGDARGLSTGVIVVAAGVWIAHETGYDRVAIEYGQKQYNRAKQKANLYKLRWDLRGKQSI